MACSAVSLVVCDSIEVEREEGLTLPDETPWDIGPTHEGSQVHFSSDVRHGVERIWYLEQLRPFLENPDSQGPSVIARYYPHVCRVGDDAIWQRAHLAYGILELVPGLLGREWVTFPGHARRGPKRAPFPGIIEVLHGSAAFLLQRPGPFDRLREVSVIWLKQRDRVLLPPGYAYVLGNRGSDVLVVAEAHSIQTALHFDDMARHRGAGYYLGPSGVRPNPHYRGLPALRELEAAVMAPLPLGPHDLYHMVIESPERFRFLHPF